MSDDSNNIRFTHIEGDVTDLKAVDKEQGKDIKKQNEGIIEVEKFNVKQEILVEDIFEKLSVIEKISNKSLEKSTQTELLTINQNKEIKEVKDKVIAIENAPKEMSKTLKIFIWSATITNGFVFLVWCIKQFITIIYK